MALGNGQTREATQSFRKGCRRAECACREAPFTVASCGDHLAGVEFLKELGS